LSIQLRNIDKSNWLECVSLKVTEEQKEFVKDNYCKMSAKDMATELGVGKHLVGHFLRKNDIRKETI